MASFIKEKEKVLIELMGPQYSLEEKNKAIKNVSMTEKYLNLNNDFENSKKNDFLIYENNNNNFKNLEKKNKENSKKINEIKDNNSQIQNLTITNNINNINNNQQSNIINSINKININNNNHIINKNNNSIINNNLNNNNNIKKEISKEKKIQSKNSFISTNSYLNFLVISANNLLKSNKITIEYLNTPSEKKEQKQNKKTQIINEKNKNLKKCSNKICSKFFEPTNINSYYCKECYDAYKKGDYCFYCGIIYRDFKGNETNNDDKSWIQCDFCHKWTHIQCEIEKGIFKNLSQLNNNDNFKYICPICRIKNQNKKRNKKSKFKGLIRKNKVIQGEIYEDILEILKLNGEK